MEFRWTRSRSRRSRPGRFPSPSTTYESFWASPISTVISFTISVKSLHLSQNYCVRTEGSNGPQRLRPHSILFIPPSPQPLFCDTLIHHSLRSWKQTSLTTPSEWLSLSVILKVEGFTLSPFTVVSSIQLNLT